MTEQRTNEELAELLGDLRLLKNWNPTQDRREEILDKVIARLRTQDGERIALDAATDALIWATCHEDFGDGGKYREGWLKVGQPALDKCLEFVTPPGESEEPVHPEESESHE